MGKQWKEKEKRQEHGIRKGKKECIMNRIKKKERKQNENK